MMSLSVACSMPSSEGVWKTVSRSLSDSPFSRRRTSRTAASVSRPSGSVFASW